MNQMVGGAPVSSSEAGYESLYVDNGTPYVTYEDEANNGNAVVMEYTGGSWQPLGSPDFTYPGSFYVYNGTPYVAYSDSGNGSKATVVEYADTTTASSTEPTIQVNINGSPLQMAVPPMIVNGRTLVPLRAIFEALGASVQWNAADQSITATKGANTIKLQIGSTTALVNGAQVTLDVAPMIVDGSTLVPLRFVSEALGCQVKWDAANAAVFITSN